MPNVLADARRRPTGILESAPLLALYCRRDHRQSLAPVVAGIVAVVRYSYCCAPAILGQVGVERQGVRRCRGVY